MNTINDFTHYQLITDHWMPSKNYKFPCSIHNKSGKTSYTNLEKYKWLVVSEKQGGLFRKYCAVFRHKHVIRKLFITESLNNLPK